MPEIHIGVLLIRREDWEGDDGSGVGMEDDEGSDAEAGGTRAISWRLSCADFGDVVTRSMFETLCEGKLPLSLSTARRKR